MSQLKKDLEELKNIYKNHSYIKEIQGGPDLISFNFIAGDIEINYTLIPDLKYPKNSQIFTPSGDIISNDNLMKIVKDIEIENCKLYNLKMVELNKTTNNQTISNNNEIIIEENNNDNKRKRSGRNGLIEDAKEMILYYQKKKGYLKDLKWENEIFLCTFDVGKQNVKDVSFSISYESYPKQCNIWTDEGQKQMKNKSLGEVLETLEKEYTEKYKKGKLDLDNDESSDSDSNNSSNSSGDDNSDSSDNHNDIPVDENFHAELERDIEQVKNKFGDDAIEVRDPIIDTVEIILYLDPKFLMQGVCNAWGITREIPIAIRICDINSTYYMSGPIPNIKIEHKGHLKCGASDQLGSIAKIFCEKEWENYKDKPQSNKKNTNQTISKNDKKDINEIDIEIDYEDYDEFDEEFDNNNNYNNNNNNNDKKSGFFSGGLLGLFSGGNKKIDPSRYQTENVNKSTVRKIIEMGYTEEQAFHAVRQKTDLESAVNLIMKQPKKCTEKYFEKENSFKEKKMKTHISFEESSKLSMKKKIYNPSNPNFGFLPRMLEYAKLRLTSLNEFCVVCDQTHLFGAPMLKPAVCNRELCVFSFSKLGVMKNAAEGLATQAEVVDFLLATAKAAAVSQRRELIFDPFPSIVDPEDNNKLALSPKNKDWKRLEQILTSVSVRELASMKEDKPGKKVMDKLAYPLMQWILASNRSHIVKLPPEKHLPTLDTKYQYILLSAPPEKENNFQELKKKHGSEFAFHGSGTENWFSILRNGLKNASGTKLQLNGAAYGAGIYLSTIASTSFGYSRMHGNVNYNNNNNNKNNKNINKNDDDSQFLDSANFNCVALCEVINHSSLRKSGSIWVCPNEDHVVTRFLFVYRTDITYSGKWNNANTQEKNFKNEILTAMDLQSFDN